MGHLDETRLPGIGTRVEFLTDERRRMGVVRHHTGRRELFVCQPGDPDTTEVAVALTEDEAHSLVEALGIVSVAEDAGERTYQVEGLVFEWIEVADDAPAIGRSIADLTIRTRTGASIVAVLREAGSVPAPDPQFVFVAGDTVVAAGTSAGVRAVRDLLGTG